MKTAMARAGALWVWLMAGIAAPTVSWADSAQLHNTAGLTYFYQGKDAQAYAEFVRATQQDPSFPEPYFNMARLFEKQNKLKEAKEQYEKTLQLDPSNDRAREKIREVEAALAKQGVVLVRPDSAGGGEVAVISEAVSTQQIDAVRSLLNKGEFTEAQVRLEQLRGATSPNLEQLRLEGELAEKQDNMPKALTAYTQAVGLAPGDPDLRYRLANVLYRLGLFDRAEQEVERALQLKPTMGEAYYLLGLVYMNTERPSEAYNAFQEAARLDPGNKEAVVYQEKLSSKLGLFYYNSGLLFFQQKDWVKAKDYLEKAIAQGNLNPEQSAIAQQYLIIADFSLAKVADQIRDIQAARKFVYKGEASRVVNVSDAADQPKSYADDYVNFTGFIVYVDNNSGGAKITAARFFPELEAREQLHRDGQRSDGGFRSNTEMDNWFTIETPQRLPEDPRIRVGSRVQVNGRLMEPKTIRNPWNFAFSRRRLPAVAATQIEFVRERRATFRDRNGREELDLEETRFDREVIGRVARAEPRPPVNTNPGLSGPLRIDFLKYTEEQQKNLNAVEPLEF